MNYCKCWQLAYYMYCSFFLHLINTTIHLVVNCIMYRFWFYTKLVVICYSLRISLIYPGFCMLCIALYLLDLEFLICYLFVL